MFLPPVTWCISMEAWQWPTSAFNTESVVRLTPAACLLPLNHISGKRGSRPQPCTAYAGKEAESCGLDRKKLAVCRRRSQAVEVMTSQPQTVEVEELQVRRNGGMHLSGKSEEGGRG